MSAAVNAGVPASGRSDMSSRSDQEANKRSARFRIAYPVHEFTLASICAKHLEESPKEHMIYSLHESMVSMCPEMSEATIPDLGVRHYRASTYKKKRNQ